MGPTQRRQTGPGSGSRPGTSRDRRRGFLRAWIPAIVPLVVALLVLVAPARGAESPADPVRVFYPAGDCATGVLEIELWNRVSQDWRPHPAHARIMADTCQLEDAGDLLNEIRVRCVDPANPARASGWLTGVQVYEPADAPGCVPPEIGLRAQGSRLISLVEPRGDSPVRSADGATDLKGRVLLGHDLVVVVDASFDAAERAAIADALTRRFVQGDALSGALRVATSFYAGEPGRKAGSKARTSAWADDAKSVRAAFDGIRRGPSAPAPAGFARALDSALDALHEERASGDRQSILALVDARADLPFGDAAGRDPTRRREVDASVQRVVGRGVGLEIVAIGRRARDLAELADQVQARIVAGGAGGGVTAVEEPGSLVDALTRVTVVTLREVRVENLTNGAIAEPLEWDLAGRFQGRIPLQGGRNLLRVRALPSRGPDIVADFERAFDATALRERLRAEERARIERARTGSRDGARDGEVRVDVEER